MVETLYSRLFASIRGLTSIRVHLRLFLTAERFRGC
jgi:hypothetical protein